VLKVRGTAPDIAAARAAAYTAAGEIRMRGGWWRRDIAAAERQPEMHRPGREHSS
jgi:phosphoribosylamine-glycine ligase